MSHRSPGVVADQQFDEHQYAPLPTEEDSQQFPIYITTTGEQGSPVSNPKAANAVLQKHAKSANSARRGVRRGPRRTGDSAQQDSKPMKQVMMEFLNSILFQTMMGLLILGNAVVIGLETDYPHYRLWPLVESCFLVVFTLEVCFRIAAYGVSGFFAFQSPDFLWNQFDLIIVSLGLSDAVAEMFSPSRNASGGLATLFRMVRLLRILRIFKIIRFLKQLYLLAYGFIEAAQAVMWVSMLMIFALYTCAIVLTRTVGNISESDVNYVFLHDRFGSLHASMLTLFELMSQPDIKAYEPVQSQYPLLIAFLIAFVIFGSFGMIALLTGVISESMFEKNQLRVDSERSERETRRKYLLDKCSELYDIVPRKEDGRVDPEDLLDFQDLLEKILMDANVSFIHADLETVVYLMDSDDTDNISKEEFLHGILAMAEEVRPMSILELFHLTSILNTKMNSCQRTMKKLEQQNDSIVGFLNTGTLASSHARDARLNTEAAKGDSYKIVPTDPNQDTDALPGSINLQESLDQIERICHQTQEQVYALSVRVCDSMVAQGLARRRDRSRDVDKLQPTNAADAQTHVGLQSQVHAPSSEPSFTSGNLASKPFLHHSSTTFTGQVSDSLAHQLKDAVSKECQKSMWDTKKLLERVLLSFLQDAAKANLVSTHGTQSGLGYAEQSERSLLGYAPPSLGSNVMPTTNKGYAMDWKQFVTEP